MDKLFTHAGVSTLKGVVKLRFANDALRVKVLAKNGHTDIDMIELMEPMTKENAINHLIAINFATQHGFTNAATQAALDEAVEALKPKAPKEPKAPKVKPTMESIKAKAAKVADAAPAVKVADPELEDAPY